MFRWDCAPLDKKQKEEKPVSWVELQKQQTTVYLYYSTAIIIFIIGLFILWY